MRNSRIRQLPSKLPLTFTSKLQSHLAKMIAVINKQTLTIINNIFLEILMFYNQHNLHHILTIIANPEFISSTNNYYDNSESQYDNIMIFTYIIVIKFSTTVILPSFIKNFTVSQFNQYFRIKLSQIFKHKFKHWNWILTTPFLTYQNRIFFKTTSSVNSNKLFNILAVLNTYRLLIKIATRFSIFKAETC